MSNLCIVQIDLHRLRENLSKGVGWKPATKVSHDKLLAHLEELGFAQNPDGQTFTARQHDVDVLRPDEVIDVSPAPKRHPVKPPSF